MKYIDRAKVLCTYTLKKVLYNVPKTSLLGKETRRSVLLGIDYRIWADYCTFMWSYIQEERWKKPSTVESEYRKAKHNGTVFKLEASTIMYCAGA